MMGYLESEPRCHPAVLQGAEDFEDTLRVLAWDSALPEGQPGHGRCPPGMLSVFERQSWRLVCRWVAAGVCALILEMVGPPQWSRTLM